MICILVFSPFLIIFAKKCLKCCLVFVKIHLRQKVVFLCLNWFFGIFNLFEKLMNFLRLKKTFFYVFCLIFDIFLIFLVFLIFGIIFVWFYEFVLILVFSCFLILSILILFDWILCCFLNFRFCLLLKNCCFW